MQNTPAASTETIAAIATAPGRGGVGVIRISGPLVPEIARGLLGAVPTPRLAKLTNFPDADGQLIDSGLALYFPAPASYTGEHVLELQGHGGPVVLDLLLSRVLALGARAARPGEFTERAYLNDKLDLSQAEAVVDLIDAGSAAAARAATASLRGEFGAQCDQLAADIVRLRVYVEAAIDFPDEDIDFLADGVVLSRLDALRQRLDTLRASADQGRALTEGLTVVIAGEPNAGKSSLLNLLARADAAIVTDIAGTTRDMLRERVVLDGLPLTVVDTAGLRETTDPVEQIGVARARAAAADADLVLLLSDETAGTDWPAIEADNCVLVRNKADQTQLPTGVTEDGSIRLSAKTGAGLDALIAALKEHAGLATLSDSGGTFSARRRHLVALDAAAAALESGRAQLVEAQAGELLAEDLRSAHDQLGAITGAMDSDALLGEIFSSFCIGK